MNTAPQNGRRKMNAKLNVKNPWKNLTIFLSAFAGDHKYPLFSSDCPASYLHPTIMSEQPSSSQTSAPVESQSADSDPQSVWPPLHKPLHPSTPRHPYRIYGYKLNNEWFAKIAKDHNIGKPDWDEGAIESAVLGYLTRLPGFQIHFVDDPSVPVYGYSIRISLATNWNRKKLERAAGRVPKWMEILGTEEKPRWYKPTVETIPPIPR
ncbi:hypothetical protein V8E55_008055 [Tylopilus felleus]